MKSIFFFSAVLFSVLFSAQQEILDRYPPGDFFYQKGELNFLRDMKNVVLENNIQPCENKEESYQPKWIVYEDSSIKFIKDFDSLKIEQNKCAYNFVKNVFKYLEGWKPVYYEGKSYAVIATYTISPSDIFDLQIDENLTDNYKPAEYPGGMSRFKGDIDRILQPIVDKYPEYVVNEQFFISFKIGKDGIIKNIKIPEKFHFKAKDEIIRKMNKLNKWKPATRNGIKMETNFTIPVQVYREV